MTPYYESIPQLYFKGYRILFFGSLYRQFWNVITGVVVARLTAILFVIYVLIYQLISKSSLKIQRPHTPLLILPSSPVSRASVTTASDMSQHRE